MGKKMPKLFVYSYSECIMFFSLKNLLNRNEIFFTGPSYYDIRTFVSAQSSPRSETQILSFFKDFGKCSDEKNNDKTLLTLRRILYLDYHGWSYYFITNKNSSARLWCLARNTHISRAEHIFTVLKSKFMIWEYPNPSSESSHRFFHEGHINGHELGDERLEMVDGLASFRQSVFIFGGQASHLSFEFAVAVLNQLL